MSVVNVKLKVVALHDFPVARQTSTDSFHKQHDDECHNITNLTSRPQELHSQAPMFGPIGPNSRIALSKAFTNTPAAIYRGKGNYTYVLKGFRSFTKPWLTLVARN